LKKFINLICLVLVFTLVACGSNGVVSYDKKKNKKLSEEQLIKKFIKLNAEYNQNEEIEQVIEQTDCSTINCAEFRLTMENIFDTYDLKYELISVKILEITSNKAEVIVTQKTTKVNGPEFRDNKGEFLHTLIKVDNNWKFKNTKVNKVEYLD